MASCLCLVLPLCHTAGDILSLSPFVLMSAGAVCRTAWSDTFTGTAGCIDMVAATLFVCLQSLYADLLGLTPSQALLAMLT
jgi:hypothetical protein